MRIPAWSELNGVLGQYDQGAALCLILLVLFRLWATRTTRKHRQKISVLTAEVGAGWCEVITRAPAWCL
jgi:hypothetical protein